MFTQSRFIPAWWLKNAHCQTIFAKFLRSKKQLTTNSETIELPDGDFIDLAWTDIPQKNETRPIVVVLHGLEGSVNSHYAKGMMSAIKEKNWLGVLMHFRGCSGRINRQARSYHSGDTEDISYLSKFLNQKYPQLPMTIIGFSLGGNVLARYLAEEPNNPYQAATIICAPLHLASCSKRINQGFSRIYQKYLVGMLKDSLKDKMASNLLSAPLSQKLHHKLDDIKTIWEFDQQVTAPINGFDSAEDYYRKASGRFILDKIKQPCLIIHSNDDPFLCDENTCDISSIPENICFEVSKGGGHVGFINGNNPLRPIFWLEHRVPNFLERHL